VQGSVIRNLARFFSEWTAINISLTFLVSLSEIAHAGKGTDYKGALTKLYD
jgi:hypothetical protein